MTEKRGKVPLSGAHRRDREAFSGIYVSLGEAARGFVLGMWAQGHVCFCFFFFLFQCGRQHPLRSLPICEFTWPESLEVGSPDTCVRITNAESWAQCQTFGLGKSDSRNRLNNLPEYLFCRQVWELLQEPRNWEGDLFFSPQYWADLCWMLEKWLDPKHDDFSSSKDP